MMQNLNIDSIAIFLLHLTLIVLCGDDVHDFHKVFSNEVYSDNKSSMPVFMLIALSFAHFCSIYFYHAFRLLSKAKNELIRMCFL